MISYRGIWLATYVFANLIAAIVFGVTDTLDGDLIDFPLPSYSILIVATIFVVLSYLIWMGPIFKFMASIRVNSLISYWESSNISRDEKFVGIFVFLVQLFFFIFNFLEASNVAGSRLQSDSPIRHLWILLVPDYLFLVYYGIYRKSRFFSSNLVLYLISNVMRGWLGTWLIVFFMEGAYRVRKGSLNWKKIVITAGIFSLFLPILIQLKWMIRETGASGLFSEEAFFLRILDMNWLEASTEAIQPILMRFQHLANVIGIMGNSYDISAGLNNGEFLYFFEEGLPQYVLTAIFGIARLPDIHNMLLTYLIPEQLPVDTITNTHVGLVGWFWIAPIMIPFYLLYLLFISWLGIWIAKKAGGAPLLMDVVWFAWLSLLMNGWFAAYIGVVQAMIVLIILRIFTAKVRWRRDTCSV
jgi:hypothetical protein